MVADVHSVAVHHAAANDSVPSTKSHQDLHDFFISKIVNFFGAYVLFYGILTLALLLLASLMCTCVR